LAVSPAHTIVQLFHPWRQQLFPVDAAAQNPPSFEHLFGGWILEAGGDSVWQPRIVAVLVAGELELHAMPSEELGIDHEVVLLVMLAHVALLAFAAFRMQLHAVDPRHSFQEPTKLLGFDEESRRELNESSRACALVLEPLFLSARSGIGAVRDWHPRSAGFWCWAAVRGAKVASPVVHGSQLERCAVLEQHKVLSCCSSVKVVNIL
jgi:hypothetical protein